MSNEILNSLLQLDKVEKDRSAMIADEGSGGPSNVIEYYRKEILAAVTNLKAFTGEQVLEVFDANISLLPNLERRKIAEIFSRRVTLDDVRSYCGGGISEPEERMPSRRTPETGLSDGSLAHGDWEEVDGL